LQVILPIKTYFAISMPKDFLARNKLLLLHLSFWILYFSYRLYDLQGYLGGKKAVMYLGVTLLFNVSASYAHYFFVLPDFLTYKRVAPYLTKLIILLTVAITCRILAENAIMPLLTSNEKYYQSLKLTRLISTVWDILTFLIFTGMIRFTADWFDFENKKKQLENEKLNAELNYLKAQINPHFLFNTLHNLNYLVYTKSDSATEVVIKLSNIMRYMIYDASKEQVSLSKELTYIRDYIDLEKIRLNYPFDVNLQIQGDVSTVEIAPLIMLTFIENAFKHGISDQEKECYINIELIADNQQIKYKVSNRKMKVQPQKKLKSGFGLNNVKQRLQLSYPKRHQLTIEDAANSYSISLIIIRS
jgi:LytS/YehU family sensor histidine kinase